MNANPDGFDLSNLRLAFLSGEMATRSDVEAIVKRVTPKIRIAYLSTEGACGLGVVSDEDQFGNSTDTPAGSPIEGSKVLILDLKDLESELPTGEVCEIALSGDSLAAGYWKDAERTAQRFVQGWWRSGDAGYRTREGRIVLVGRTDHVINSGGIKIQAEEIEAELMRHPAVRQAAVVGIPDLRWGQRAEAFVVVSETKVNSTILEHWAKSDDRIPAARLLKAIHIVDELPTGPTGKLFRPALIPSSSRARHAEGSVK
jgi:acyl-coenzyme A synthetase/AMP-(fatty) acid ligase